MHSVRFYLHYVNPKSDLWCTSPLAKQHYSVVVPRTTLWSSWTLPAGYMELFETMEQGATRETREEAEAEVDIQQLYCMYNIPRIGQIYVLFKADLLEGKFGAGEETIESNSLVKMKFPWDELASPSVERTLRHYFADRKTGQFEMHLETLGTRLDHTG